MNSNKDPKQNAGAFGDEIKKEIAKEICKRFGFPQLDLLDYVEENFGEAMDACLYGGSIYDLDSMILLKEILGFNISYNLYAYIDSYFCENDINILDADLHYEELMDLCQSYFMDNGNTNIRD